MIIVAGIGTEIGKTVTSAILCEALGRDYWKPVQAGELENSDSHKLQAMVSREGFTTHPEAFRLNAPMSPHAAAEIDQTHIDLDQLLAQKPADENLIVELAGGIMVPLSYELLNIDLMAALSAPVALVANYYLGSINHTLLTINALQQANIEILGVVFNGTPNPDSRKAIIEFGQIEILAEVPEAENLDKEFIRAQADILRQHPKLAGI